jgi:hypothetical protein
MVFRILDVVEIFGWFHRRARGVLIVKAHNTRKFKLKLMEDDLASFLLQKWRSNQSWVSPSDSSSFLFSRFRDFRSTRS